MYRSAIINELGWPEYWIDELTREEIEKILEEHPEWSIRAIEL